MSRYSSTSLRSGGGGGVPSLPPKFTELSKVLGEQVHLGSMINVIGMVKDCRLPVPTNGSDFKSSLTLFDISTQSTGGDVVFDVFRPEDMMPDVSARDVIVIFQAKVQRYRQNPISLLSNRSTIIHVYTAGMIPRFPKPALPALMRDKKAAGTLVLEGQHHRYVSWFYQEIDKEEAPDQEEFQQRSKMSLNVKDKFSLLKDVVEDKFYNLIVQVARQPFDLHDKVTLYVSDYTENDAFFHITWDGLSSLPGIEDPFGYMDPESSPAKREWFGPYGKKAIQITCWPPHSDFIRNEVSAGQWIYLRNVQIRRGRDGQYLEGYLREDRDAATKINVDVMDASDPENADPRLKEAVRRLRDYSKEKNKQEKEIIAAQIAGAKRRQEDTSHDDQPKAKENSRKRRQAKRAALEKEEKEKRLSEEARIELNDQVVCEEQSKPPESIEAMLELPQHTIVVEGIPVNAVVPFSCSKFRGRVRVVDFYPEKLDEFARRRFKNPNYAIIEDESEDESSSEYERDPGYKCVWEWRFALKLQDALPQKGNNKEAPKTLWVTVDNSEAQYLTRLDACNLKEDEDRLAELRERMFTLWGNLEEKKRKNRSHGDLPSKLGTKGHGGRPKLPQLERPPLDSSDHEDNGDHKAPGEDSEEALSNKPFDCCIKSYGLRNEDLPTGIPEREWIRAFALFGTKIRG